MDKFIQKKYELYFYMRVAYCMKLQETHWGIGFLEQV